MARGRCDRQAWPEHHLLVDVDDRHQQREDEWADDEADDAEHLHYQEPNAQGKLVRCTRGELRYWSRRRRATARSEPLLEEEEARVRGLKGVL